ncbi:MAG: PAS domain-containing protein, partial [Desulfobacterales bacterium]
MLEKLLKSNIAIIGGGRFCKNILELFHSEHFKDSHPTILGVADVNNQAEGIVFARELGIATTNDYRDLFQLEDLQILMELTPDVRLGVIINMTKPCEVEFIDHVEARTMWTSLRVELEKRKVTKELRANNYVAESIDSLFKRFSDRLIDVITERNNRYMEIERELIESERALSQIIEGSTIPTFVMNKEHAVTHWNRAMEKVTGVSTEAMVGSRWPSTV